MLVSTSASTVLSNLSADAAIVSVAGGIVNAGGLQDDGVLSILDETGALDLIDKPGTGDSKKCAGTAPGDHVTNHFHAGRNSIIHLIVPGNGRCAMRDLSHEVCSLLFYSLLS